MDESYDQRIGTRISREANARLRYSVLLYGKSISALLSDLITRTLPPAPPEVAGRFLGITAQEATA